MMRRVMTKTLAGRRLAGPKGAGNSARASPFGHDASPRQLIAVYSVGARQCRVRLPMLIGREESDIQSSRFRFRTGASDVQEIGRTIRILWVAYWGNRILVTGSAVAV
jgi:hypothetical protein